MLFNNTENYSIQDKPLTPLFIKGELSQRIFNLLGVGIGFISSFFIITYLSVYEFGLYQLVLSFVAILSSLDLGLFDGIIAVEMRRYFNVGKDYLAKKLFKETVFFRVSLSTILTGVVFLSSGFITQYYGENISLLIKVASLLLVIKSFQSVQEIFFQSIVSFSYFGLAAIREIIKLFLIIVLVLTSNLSILGVISAHVVAEALATVFCAILMFIKKYKQIFGVIDLKSFRGPCLIKAILKNNGYHFFLRYSMSRVLKNVNPWLVKFFLNTEAVAFYALAVNLISLANDLVPMVGFQSILALKADNKKAISRIVKRAIKYTFWVGIIFLLGGIFVVPIIATFIFPKYAPAMPIFEVMALALPLFGAFKILKSTLFVLREQAILTQRLINELLITFIGSFILLPAVGVVGMGIIHFSIYAERVSFMYLKLAHKHLDFQMKILSLFKWDKTDKEFFSRVPVQLTNVLRQFVKSK